MIHIRPYIVILIINIIIISCTTISKNTINNSPTNFYKSAKNNFYKSNYKGAIQDLTNLKNLYLFDPHSQQIYLYLIYAYYKVNDLKSSNETIQYFLKLYPNYKHLDYVLYMHGLVNMTLDKNYKIPIKFININWVDSNPIYANIAFQSFIKLVHIYPHSSYALDAYKRLIFLKNRIAEYELSIIKFYDKKQAYVSVIYRSEKMLRYFPDTQATRKALFYMHKAYQKMYINNQADKIMKIIATNSKN